MTALARAHPGLRADLRRLVAVAHREWKVAASYQFQIGLSFGHTLLFAISFYFIGEFVGQPAALQDSGAGYFEFALVGVIATSVVDLAVREFSAIITEEQESGTLEMVLATPTPIWTVLGGGVVVSAVFTAIEVLILSVFGFVLVGSAPSFGAIMLSIPLLVLMFLAFSSVGISAAAIIVIVKRGDPLAGPISQLTGLVSGAYYPISVLPGWLQPASWFLPATWTLRGVRALTIDNAGAADIVDELAILSLMVVVSLPLSLWFFERAVGAARTAGTLSNY